MLIACLLLLGSMSSNMTSDNKLFAISKMLISENFCHLFCGTTLSLVVIYMLRHIVRVRNVVVGMLLDPCNVFLLQSTACSSFCGVTSLVIDFTYKQLSVVLVL